MNEKALLRKEFKAIRAAAFRREAAEDLRDKFLQEIEINNEMTIASYFPFATELNVNLLNSKILNAGCTICLPCINGKEMTFRKWNSDTKTSKGRIPEPVDSRIIAPQDIDIFIVPLLAFDDYNFRLGYGGGYYDRAFVGITAQKIGVAYDEQFSDTLPREDHDIALDRIISV